MFEAIMTQLAVYAALALGGWALSLFKKALDNNAAAIDTEKAKRVQDGAKDAVEIAVAAVQPLADELKARASDGKLDKVDQEKLKDLAKQKALEIATGPVADHLVKMGADALGGLVELIIGKRGK